MKKQLNKIILIFIIGSVLGTFYEEILHIVKFYMKYKTFDWVPKRGLLYSPISPVYGIGILIIYILFYLKKRKWYQTFILGCLFGGVYEFTMGFLQETIWGTISWDYSDKFLNIGGRTTVPFMIFWGLLVIAFVYLIFPLLDKLYSKFREKTINNLTLVLSIILILDVLITISAVTRQTLRHSGVEAKTFIGEFCDKHYTDQYLKKIYTTSKIVKK